MTSNQWRERTEARLEADKRQLHELELEIAKLRRLLARTHGKIEARETALRDDDELRREEPGATRERVKQRRELRQPILAELDAVDGGLSRTELAVRLKIETKADRKSLNTCVWRMLHNEDPPLISEDRGRLRITRAGKRERS